MSGKEGFYTTINTNDWLDVSDEPDELDTDSSSDEDSED